MEKLTQENIQFIGDYLKNSGVEYLDVRVELTDHVASEIEAKMNDGDGRGFYEIFKGYMLGNKTALMKNLKKFRKQADKKMLRHVLKNSVHWKTLISTTTIFFVLFKMEFLTGLQVDLWIYMAIILLAFFIFLKFTFGSGAKFSTLQRLLFWLGLVDYFAFSNLLQLSFTGTWGYMIAFLVLWLNVSAVKSMIDLKVYYKREFQLA